MYNVEKVTYKINKNEELFEESWSHFKLSKDNWRPRYYKYEWNIRCIMVQQIN